MPPLKSRTTWNREILLPFTKYRGKIKAMHFPKSQTRWWTTQGPLILSYSFLCWLPLTSSCQSEFINCNICAFPLFNLIYLDSKKHLKNVLSKKSLVCMIWEHETDFFWSSYGKKMCKLQKAILRMNLTLLCLLHIFLWFTSI